MAENTLESPSILTTIKRMLDISDDVTSFDSPLVTYINTAIVNLSQLGVGPSDGFQIASVSDNWTNLITDTAKSRLLNLVKTYIYLKVKLLFDPPTNGNVIQSFNEIIAEYEYRIKLVLENTSPTTSA